MPSFYWAAGGMLGARTTLSPQLVELARERVPWFVAVVWITGVLKVVAGLLALALARPRGRLILRRALLTAACGAGVLLAWHGALFIIAGALVQSGVVTGGSAVPNVILWYTFLWGPWFLIGGLLFLAAAWSYLKRSGDRRAGLAFGALGGLGALCLSAAMLILGIG